MNFLKTIIITTLFLTIAVITANAESNRLYKQTVRGKVIDQDSKTSIIGANVIVIGSNPIMGTSTDLDGNFRIDNVSVGRIEPPPSITWHLHMPQVPPPPQADGRKISLADSVFKSVLPGDTVNSLSLTFSWTSP